MNQLEIYIDGASQGNPGHSGIGAVIYRGEEKIRELSDYIGIATNNVAEYTALIYALEEALLLKAAELKINTDSQLLARQLNKIYKVKHPGIISLYRRATHLLTGFEKVSVNHIPREQNRLADKLATQGIKDALGNSLI
ncbi:MAG: ribonuclease HI family protein [Candidatus Omnitrophica bacterium]|jgi:ribonuclease HI|nr:ribonuclease HI family protein [Candidatus Omnitrophota bacterium]MDD3274807.1 ribonuclease HI family protein [Candidatus Omnitrophota bacterium]MDD5077671.1 ribonuclease HI family protein [Candidatus Omnitrophota bacterium]MDD5725143.1 ribonuclease HI family protein [Candidatus Omnitrophota bacterium]